MGLLYSKTYAEHQEFGHYCLGGRSPTAYLQTISIWIKEKGLFGLAIRLSPLMNFNSVILELLNKGIEIGDGEADMVTSGQILRVSDG